MRLVGPITALQHADRWGTRPPFFHFEFARARAPTTAVVVVTIVIVIRIVWSVEIARLDDRELADLRVVLVHSLSGPVIATHRHLPFPSRSFRES